MSFPVSGVGVAVNGLENMGVWGVDHTLAFQRLFVIAGCSRNATALNLLLEGRFECDVTLVELGWL